MRTAFIIIAIFAAVVLLVKFAAPSAKPMFISGERITQSALINNIRALGVRCAVTENGLGVSQSLGIKHVIDECKKRVSANTADYWQNTLLGGSDVVLRALCDGKKCAKYSGGCAHVGKYPRVYLFCEMLTRQSGCLFTRELLLNCISAFEENATFTQSERKILCGILRFCLIGHLSVAAEEGLKRAEMYDKGIGDGKSGRVDLTNIHVDDYVCGLMDGCADSERKAVVGLFEHNGVDVNAANKNRRKFLAQIYVTVSSVLRSLSVVDECENDIYTPINHGEHAKRYEKAFNIIFPILLAVYAVLTCIFASPKYVALFSVASILTYGVMRIPVILYFPDGAINIFAPIERLLFGFFRRKKNVALLDNGKQLLSETAYFGSEPQYAESTIEGGLNVHCDNRGDILIDSGENADSLYFGIKADELTTSLNECDGVIERHRATYHVCKRDIEMCAEVLVPIDISACIVKLTVINRSEADKAVSITSAVVRNTVADCITEDVCGGAMVNCYDGFALSIDGGKYGGDLSAFCANGTLRHARTNKPALIGVSDINVKGFSRACIHAVIAYAHSKTEVESLFRYISDELFYLRAEAASSVYCGLNKSIVLPTVQDVRREARTHKPVAKYPSPDLPKCELLFSLPFGGITDDNSVVITDNAYCKSLDNTVTNGRISMTVNQFGIQNISLDGLSVTPPPDAYLHVPRAFVVIGENGSLWSPTSRLFDCGKMYAVHSRGYTEYTCSYDGAVCTQKCFAAESAVFIEVTLCNKTSALRGFDIMFSTQCKSEKSVARAESGVTTDGLLFCALGEHAEYALYKEGYYIYGHIARASGFRVGGCTPAPTLSVNKIVKPKSGVKVVFCITDSTCKNLPDIDGVDDLFDSVKCFYNRLGRIYPNTDDSILNISCIQALYSAYTAFISQTSMSLRDESLVMSAVKYADPSAVKNRIYKILANQDCNGELGEYVDCLQFLRCVSEYSQFMLDCDFWDEVLPYAARRRRAVIKETAYAHILRAVKHIIINPAPYTESLIQSVWTNKTIIEVLRFWQDKIKDDALLAACKKRFAVAANEYSRQVKRLMKNNFFEFGSVAEAYMCAILLFDLDQNEKAYNIIKYNNPIERCMYYGERAIDEFDYFSDPAASAVYFVAVVERLFGVKFRGKTAKICPHTSSVTPKTEFCICGKTKDIHITVDDTRLCGNWKMRVNRINYPADSVKLSELSDDIVFYRDGNE
ncbi:MAG: hypothetical protein K2O04_03375 [Clostridiales bacterium]|nr:hypothetical protein [Clostridiales bacterium]